VTIVADTTTVYSAPTEVVANNIVTLDDQPHGTSADVKETVQFCSELKKQV
jgi:hypothetical protein